MKIIKIVSSRRHIHSLLSKSILTAFFCSLFQPIFADDSGNRIDATDDPVEYVMIQSELESLGKDYTAAVRAGDHAEAAGLSARMLTLMERILDPGDEKIGIQSLATGLHYLQSSQSKESLPYLRRATEIIPDNDPEKQKQAYETLLVALASSNSFERGRRTGERGREFRENVHILSCLLLPPVPDNMPDLAESSRLEYPIKLQEHNLMGWGILTHSINKDGDLSDINFLSIWPQEVLKKKIMTALESRRYEPPIVDGQSGKLENVPLVMTFLLKDPGFQPPGKPYDLWVRALEMRWDSEREGSFDCREIVKELEETNE